MNAWASQIVCPPRSEEAEDGLDRDTPAARLSAGPIQPGQTAYASASAHGWWRQSLAFMGPGYLVAMGYMDPGNWVTTLAGGSQYGYALLSIVVFSSFMAMLLQAAAIRLGLATGMDLAQICRRHFSPGVNRSLWLTCELAIVACDLAEVLGMACGLRMVFHIPLASGVLVASGTVVMVLGLRRRGARALEIFLFAIALMVGISLGLQLWWVHPSMGAVATVISANLWAFWQSL